MLPANHKENGFSRNLYFYAGWLLLFAAVVFAYYPGLGGPFVLDDHSSLARLGDFNGVRNWETFKAFVFGGTAGPTGRPLSLLSFLIDGNNWPTDPWPFKRTNLVIHLLNGALVGLLVSKLLDAMQYDKEARRWIAFVAAACWLLHPFLVSTTLYAVQRMAQLTALFMLAGVIAWLHGRLLIPVNPRRAYLWMSLSLPLFTFLAMISKENGILLPLLVGAVEITVFSANRERFAALDRRWTALFVGLPFVVIFGYLVERMLHPTFFTVLPPRNFSVYERLLTEPRILVDYLQNWFIPKLYTTGVFQDHVVKSTGLFTPVTTVISILFILGLLGFAFWSRRKWPLLALAILFFFVNHLLESTVVNLELYFEHRNYLAVCLFFVPLAAVLWNRSGRRVFALVSLATMLLLGGFTRYSSTVWQTYDGIVQASAAKAPTSARAQTQYAVILFNANYHDEGMRVLDDAIANIPGDNPLLLATRLIAMCNLKTLEPAELDRIAALLSSLKFDARMLRVYNNFAKAVVTNTCPKISLRSILPMFTRMLDVPENANPTSIEYTHIKFLIGYVRLYLGEIDGAMAEFKDSLAARPGASYAMAMAALFATSGFPEEALHLSDIALTQLDTENNTTLIGLRANEADIREFQVTVRAQLDAQRDAGNSPPGD
jgi:tetratricopeptide (TPR) repeat protein